MDLENPTGMKKYLVLLWDGWSHVPINYSTLVKKQKEKRKQQETKINFSGQTQKN